LLLDGPHYQYFIFSFSRSQFVVLKISSTEQWLFFSSATTAFVVAPYRNRRKIWVATVVFARIRAR